MARELYQAWLGSLGYQANGEEREGERRKEETIPVVNYTVQKFRAAKQ